MGDLGSAGPKLLFLNLGESFLLPELRKKGWDEASFS